MNNEYGKKYRGKKTDNPDGLIVIRPTFTLGSLLPKTGKDIRNLFHWSMSKTEGQVVFKFLGITPLKIFFSI